MYLMTVPKIGDKYEIRRVKQRGKDNNMQIDQKNIKRRKRAKKGILKRIFTKK
jgi:hypothetical protein